ncbi:MAG TPA: hypothetical protein PKW25_07045 [Syntrophomonadaceae bacterium]|nr:hypothetical protein [Syntrophomonadaceae bacterium]
MHKKVINLQRQTPTVQQMLEQFIYWKRVQGLRETTHKRLQDM